MIKSFSCKKSERLYQGLATGQFQVVGKKARVKLRMLDAAETIRDLQSPPSNHLEKLSGDRKGQYSIRINRQWRICFYWSKGQATEVEIVDYH